VAAPTSVATAPPSVSLSLHFNDRRNFWLTATSPLLGTGMPTTPHDSAGPAAAALAEAQADYKRPLMLNDRDRVKKGVNALDVVLIVALAALCFLLFKSCVATIGVASFSAFAIVYIKSRNFSSYISTNT